MTAKGERAVCYSMLTVDVAHTRSSIGRALHVTWLLQSNAVIGRFVLQAEVKVSFQRLSMVLLVILVPQLQGEIKFMNFLLDYSTITHESSDSWWEHQ